MVLFFPPLAQTEPPVISIPDGQLRGISNKTVGQNITYFAYRGIPYAKPPINDLRFAAPVKNNPWTGTLDATRDKDICVQFTEIAAVPGTPVLGSEDCLYINVYTTNITGNRPTMVWIHGGGFFGGDSTYPSYSPDYILEKDVVYVSFNYRLGVFGFLSTEDLVAPGNWGLKDQVLALQWVQTNIAYFGGNPDNVTIFGESAGAASVSYLTQSRLAKGLFRRSILQSGSSLCLWSLSRNAARNAFDLGVSMGIFTKNSQTLINGLRKINYKILKQADSAITVLSILKDNILAGLPFGVVKEPDHPGALFANRSWEQIKNGNFSSDSMIIGFNSDEVGAFTQYIDIVRPVLFYYDLFTTRLVPYDLTSNSTKRKVVAQEIRDHFFKPISISLQTDNLAEFLSWDQFIRPIRETATLASKTTDVYYYKFSYKGLLGDPKNATEGVAHAEELNYLFANRGHGTNQDLQTVETVTTLWTNFAKFGNPTPASSLNVSLKWEPNGPNTNANVSIKYLDIGTEINMKTNPFQVDWTFYQGIYLTQGEPPYSTY